MIATHIPASQLATCLPDLEELDALLLPDGRLTPVPAGSLRLFETATLRVWCHYRGVYGLPTIELVDTLRALIGGRRAIEIGAGRGVFGRALGIPMTDSRVMEEPAVRANYAQLQQPTTPYGDDVEKLDAKAAVAKYRPEVVFGSWITQYASPLPPMPPGGGSIYGVDEVAMMKRVSFYLLFGSRRVHGQKLLFRQPGLDVRVVDNDQNWFSRSPQAETCLYIVTRKR